MNLYDEKFVSVSLFAMRMQEVRKEFPEHSGEIDRAIYEVGQKLDSCGNPDCTCKMSYENFHEMAEIENVRKQNNVFD